MTVKLTKNAQKLYISVTGRLDTATAPELDARLKENISGITDLTMDFAELDYVSSAGLRVILSAQKAMTKQGKMVIKNVNPAVNEVFEITGFTDILTIE